MKHTIDTPADGEFIGASFGDKRLDVRLEKLVDALMSQPAKSFPDAVGNSAALEATYRFLGNSKVSPSKILAPHIEATVGRACRAEGRIIIAHDTTALIFPGKSRSEVGWVNQGSCGFLGHFSLAVERSENARALGVVGMVPFFRTGKAKGKNPKRSKKDRKTGSESVRWWRAIEQTQYLFPTGVDPIHVADREADDYSLFAGLTENNFRFVIRIRQNRCACKLDGEVGEAKLFELLEKLTVIAEREAPISKRSKGTYPRMKKDQQPRNARSVKLHMRAGKVTLSRSSFQFADLPKTIDLNCVHVYEVNAPNDDAPIDWKLFTTEPIETESDILNIVDDYRARWKIEEYFKALKTGCAYEKRQLESRQSLLNALAVFAPIAWQLLSLKTNYAMAPANEVLSSSFIEVLRAFHPKSLPEVLNINDAMYAVAAQGGHILNNGPPGWQVLNRGLQKLLLMETAWIAAKKDVLNH